VLTVEVMGFAARRRQDDRLAVVESEARARSHDYRCQPEAREHHRRRNTGMRRLARADMSS